MPQPNKILLRDFKYKQALEDWKLNDKSKEIDILKGLYEDFLLDNNSKHLLVEKGQGHEAVLYSHLSKFNINVSFLLDYLRGKVIELRYYNYLSDSKTDFLDGGLKLHYERHYLKPIHGIKPDAKNEIHFGNILLENCIPNTNKNTMLKILVTPYPGMTVEPFSKLMKALLKS